jgi:hypothetical protein
LAYAAWIGSNVGEALGNFGSSLYYTEFDSNTGAKRRKIERASHEINCPEDYRDNQYLDQMQTTAIKGAIHGYAELPSAVFGMATGIGVGVVIKNLRLAGKVHPITKIPFDKHGFPDFSLVTTRSVTITQTGDRAADFAAANRAAGYECTPKGFTWHHHQDKTTMQLVPTEIHTKTGHTGGVGIILDDTKPR